MAARPSARAALDFFVNSVSSLCGLCVEKSISHKVHEGRHKDHKEEMDRETQ